ncbi:hypothetical protein KFL_005360015 [Klebsormidium nitens]|uniref:Uncharacterized protein n=1 Tax=Klebsormidium nitens TaxID=105231 RepID=A0A1Y1IN66_KLENI|nr:hypothetical protein KFL_005360015 [Klebsormidium nitens]|eukprot:GAQ89558.1 hypothetical protein KFL_005360015 [Klebsormidium nitens]
METNIKKLLKLAQKYRKETAEEKKAVEERPEEKEEVKPKPARKERAKSAPRPRPRPKGRVEALYDDEEEKEQRQETQGTPVQANAGDTISITLPENSIVNLDAFTLYANLNTAAGTCPPRHAESLIDQITVLVNGIQVGPGSQMTNYLSTALIDWYGADKTAQRQVMQLGGDVTAPTSATVPAAVTSPNGKKIAISHFLGFLSSAQPRYLDTSILGQTNVSGFTCLTGTTAAQRGEKLIVNVPPVEKRWNTQI